MEPWLTRMTDYLLAQSWQIAVLTVVVALASFLLRNRSAHVRYLLWLIVLAKALVPPLYSIPVAVLPQHEPIAYVPAAPTTERMVAEHRVPEAAVTEPPRPASVQPEAALSPAVSTKLAKYDLRVWLAVAWLAGVVALSFYYLVNALRTQIWLQKRRMALPSESAHSIKSFFAAHGVKRMPRVWLLERINQPFVWGLVRGSIYLPAKLWHGHSFGCAQDMLGRDFLHGLEARATFQASLLGHELSHVIRLDAMVNSLQVIAQTVFWFHPFVWWANRKIRAEREKCCDEMTIARLNALPEEYGEAIVETLAAKYEQARPVPSLAIAGQVKNIEERIKTMLTPGKKFYKRPSLIAASIVLFAALLTVPTALVLTARAQTEPPKAETNSDQTLHQAAAAGDKEQVQKLLAQGADIHAKDKDGRTPLHSAAWYGRKDVAAVLLAQGANINEADGSGQTPLHLAANFDGKLLSEFLLAQGAQIDARDNAGNTPLHAAADLPEVGKDLLELLIAKGADVKARNDAGQTPLHRVSMIRRLDKHLERTAEALLALGAEIDAKDKSGYTPLHFAVERGHRELVDLLVAKGADVRTRAADGTTLLHQAVKSGQLEMVEWSLSRGIDINSAGSDGWTALHLALAAPLNANSININSIVQALIARGADVKARDVRGNTPAQIAVGHNRKDAVRLLLDKGAEVSTIQIAAYLGDLGAVKGFLERGGPVNAQDGDWRLSPLGAAVLGGQKDVAAFLISQGASVNAEQEYRMTALHCAAWGGSKEVAELLLANGAKVDAKTQDDATPLGVAASWGAKDVALLLIDHGADVNAETAQKRRPLDYAVRARSGRKDMAKLLIDKGAGTSQPDNLLFWACGQVDKDLAELVIQKGANVNSQAWGYAPAMEAMWSGYTKATKPADVPRLLGVLKVLLDQGADPDAKDRWDWSLLHYACGNVDLTKLLLDRGANPNVRTCGGRTPLHFVADEGNKAATQLLLSRGADVNAKDFDDGHTPLSYAEDVDNDMWGKPRKTPLTAEAKAAKKEVAELLRRHGAKE
jgi:ankyrin repeat protein/beta-lactamase regulating signal transducer with metallopeptidase domain